MRRHAACLLALLALMASAAAPAPAPGADAPPSAAAQKKHKGKTKRQKALAKCRRAAKRKRAGKVRRRALRRCERRHGRSKRRPAKPKPAPPVPAPVPPRVDGGIDDAVVVAVLDFGVNPYHHDFAASLMPQHRDAEPGNDLPLDRPASEWLPGLAGTDPGWRSFDRIDLPLSADPEEQAAALEGDAKKLQDLKVSTPGAVHAYWMPHTKVIGAATFAEDGALWRGVGAHGVGTTSSSVGNLHGTCPECLLFFVELGGDAATGEAAIDWVMRQPWIDAISNSYGYSIAVRDRIYSGSNTDLQRQASERGQTVFFSSGNGQAGAFDAPNTTEFSSQEGPDWIVTVGAVSPGRDNYYGAGPAQDDEEGHGSYVGAGKPADIAGIGSDYPTAYTSPTVGGTGASGFGGTSNATPQIAGLYSRTLYRARTALSGPSRSQAGGVVATGAHACGAARVECELGDGALTAGELRQRLFHGAVHSSTGMAVYTAGAGPTPTVPPVGEDEFLNEGHGNYAGREGKRRDAWLEEFETRLAAPLEGRGPALQRPAGEREWFVVDSYCRQRQWGEWRGGYYVEGETELPPPDPAWPVRSERMQACLGGPVP